MTSNINTLRNEIYIELRKNMEIYEIIRLYEIDLFILSNKINQSHNYINKSLKYKKDIIRYLTDFKSNNEKFMIYSIIIFILWFYFNIYNIYHFLAVSLLFANLVCSINIYLQSKITNNIDFDKMKSFLTNKTENNQIDKIRKKITYLSRNYRISSVQKIIAFHRNFDINKTNDIINNNNIKNNNTNNNFIKPKIMV